MTLKEFLELNLNEDEYRTWDLTPEERKQLFSVFKKTYMDSTGHAFSDDQLERKTNSWTFFGEKTKGGIAARKQGHVPGYKITGSFGPMRQVINGFKELVETKPNATLWTAVTADIANLFKKKRKDESINKITNEFVILPKDLVIIAKPAIEYVSACTIKKIYDDGGFDVDKDIGGENVITKKFALCNKNYLRYFMGIMEGKEPQNPIYYLTPPSARKEAIDRIKTLL